MSNQNNQDSQNNQQQEEKSVYFEDFNFSSKILDGVKAAGFKVASPIQALSIPFIQQGKDVIAQAHTGTGKTAAFALPTMDKLTFKDGVEILVITPTRELANQVSDEMYMLGKHADVRTVTIYGGKSSKRQLDLIGRGAQVVVATPGRLLDLLGSKQLKNFNPSFVVLDEADEMLDMGFLEDIQKIFKYLPENRQTLLFSATMPQAIKNLANQILNEPEFIGVTKKETTNADITQQYYVIEEHERDAAITRIIDAYDVEKSILFCRTKREVERVSTHLIAQGYATKGLHGDMEQHQREEVIKGFRSGALEILVATDVAARGLSVADVTHVFNYHIPFDSQSYVHRIGRTGRAGKKGIAITLVSPLEYKELQKIKKAVGTSMSHAIIPSRDHVNKIYIDRFAQSIIDSSINDDATSILESIGDTTDVQTLLLKTISLMLEKKSVSGPDQIGLSSDQLEKWLERNDRSRSDHNGNRNSRRRRPNNRDRNRNRDSNRDRNSNRDYSKDSNNRDRNNNKDSNRDSNNNRDRDRNRDGNRDSNRDSNNRDRKNYGSDKRKDSYQGSGERRSRRK